jgi:hypothetical protein
MKNTFNLKLALLALAIPAGLSSCSKKDTVDSLSITAPAQDVKVLANGRLAFADTKAFNQALTTMSAMASPELDKWEKNLGFHSLRQSTAPESAKLLNEFGFSGQYAALISEAGEYQIGDRISWFHDGFRYVANSEQELADIKANPTTATEKFSAGLVKHTSKGQAAAREIRNSDNQEGDGRYNGQEVTIGPGSVRKLSFESILYCEDVSDRYTHAFAQRVWYTSISINEYYEYHSSRAGTWYRADDYPRTTSYNLNATATINGSGFYQYNSANPSNVYNYDAYVTNSISLNQYAHGGTNDFRTTVISALIGSISRPGTMYWDYSIQGSYNTDMSAAYAMGGSANYGNVYNAKSGQLW